MLEQKYHTLMTIEQLHEKFRDLKRELNKEPPFTDRAQLLTRIIQTAHRDLRNAIIIQTATGKWNGEIFDTNLALLDILPAEEN